jgi:hypothetical protein
MMQDGMLDGRCWTKNQSQRNAVYLKTDNRHWNELWWKHRDVEMQNNSEGNLAYQKSHDIDDIKKTEVMSSELL